MSLKPRIIFKQRNYNCKSYEILFCFVGLFVTWENFPAFPQTFSRLSSSPSSNERTFSRILLSVKAHSTGYKTTMNFPESCCSRVAFGRIKSITIVLATVIKLSVFQYIFAWFNCEWKAFTFKKICEKKFCQTFL